MAWYSSFKIEPVNHLFKVLPDVDIISPLLLTYTKALQEGSGFYKIASPFTIVAKEIGEVVVILFP